MRLAYGGMFAGLATEMEFSRPGGIFSANIGLEENFGLKKTSYISTFSGSYRFTTRSGIFAHYYGMNRTNEKETNQDYIFVNDTIPGGTNVRFQFRTNVFSIGYLLTIHSSEDAFLGMYFNVFTMGLNFGLESEEIGYDRSISYLIPLPDVGFLLDVKIKSWLGFVGNVGIFYINFPDFTGTLNNLSLALDFKPLAWLSIWGGYQAFMVNAVFPEDNIDVRVNYNYKGPTLGVSFMF